MSLQGERTADVRSGTPRDAAAFATEVAAAWAEGERGWERLAEAWAAPIDAAPPRPVARCWWDEPPWHGQIPDEEFRAIVAAYVARYGAYTPDLPEREPELLRAWTRREDKDGARHPRAAA